MWAQLGDHVFQGLKTFLTLSENYAVKYGRISLVNGKDIIQFTGEELSELSITTLYSIDFCNPTTEIEALVKSMRDAEILPLIMGDGTIVGAYVITSIDKQTLRTSPNGVLEVASVSFNLLEKAGVNIPAPTGKALINQQPIAESPTVAIETPSNNIASDVSAGKNKVNQIKALGSKIKAGTTDFRQGVRQVRQLSDDAKQAYSSAKTKVTVTQKIIKRAGKLPTSLDDAIKYAENLAKFDYVADMSVLQMNIEQLSDSSDKVTQHAAPVAAFSATREGGQ